MIAKKDITGIILAGGKSSRMKTEKGLVSLGDKPFIAHIFEALRPLVSDIMVVSQNSEYDGFGFQRVQDLIPDSGPLAGLYTGFTHTETPYNLVLSCDVPLIRTEVLEHLIAHADPGHGAVLFSGLPLIALYKAECSAVCLSMLESGEKRLQSAVSQMNPKTLELPVHWNAYVKNINTIDELNALKHDIEH